MLDTAAPKNAIDAQQKARDIIKACADEPLSLERQTSARSDGLGIGTWNLRAYGNMHSIPGSLPAKCASLWEVASTANLQLLALQECPGRATAR
jgi:hypothetical protein